MIRPFRMTDLDQVLAIWLEANVRAHDFIAPEYWQGNLDLVRELLPQAELYVYEEETGAITGFIGLDGHHIQGLFVKPDRQGHGTGQALLSHAKQVKHQLSLAVYSKNQKALNFYHKQGFETDRQELDTATQEMEYHMIWVK